MHAHIHGVATGLRDVGDGAQCSRTEHDLMLVNQRVLVHLSEDVASGDVVANLYSVSTCTQNDDLPYFEVCRGEVPFERSVEGICVDATRNVDRFRQLLNAL